MKKLLSILLIIVTCVSFAGCENVNTTVKKQPEEPIFDYHLPEWLVWGMKEGEVRKNLGENIHDFNGLISPEKTVLYKNSSVDEYYGFSKDNALIYMSYTFKTHSFMGENKYFEIFSEFREKMIEEYGPPISENEQWVNERYKNDNNMMYKAIDEGDYISKTVWKLADGYCSIELKEKVNITYSIEENGV